MAAMPVVTLILIPGLIMVGILRLGIMPSTVAVPNIILRNLLVIA